MAKDNNLAYLSGNLPPMSAEHSELYRAQKRRQEQPPEHRELTRPRLRPPSNTKSTRAPSKSKTKPKKRKSKRVVESEEDEDEDRWFTIRNIIDEKIQRGKVYYLVDWEGTDKNGRPYTPTWQPEFDVTELAISAWKESKAEAKRARDTTNATIAGPRSTSDASNTTESGTTNQTNRTPKIRMKKRPLEQEEKSELSKEAVREHRRISIVVTSKGTDRGVKVPKYTSEVPSGRDDHKSIEEGIPASGILGDSRPGKGQIVIELPGKPEFDTDEYIPVSLSSQQTSIPLSSQSASFGTSPAVQKSELKNEDHRVIPDSQEISGFSSFATQESIVGFQGSITASEVFWGVTAASQQNSKKFQPLGVSAQLTVDIPSHQPDNRTGNSRENLSGSAFVVETNPSSTQPNNSQSNTGGSFPVFSTQENLNLDIIPPTSQPSESSSVPLPGPISDEPISAASASRDLQSVNSISIASRSNSQAAQIVVPLSSQQGGLATNTDANFTVYDDDSIVPDTVLRDTVSNEICNQHDSQHSSQALSELDGNTRSASSSKGHLIESQLASDCVELSQSNLNKATSCIEAEEASTPAPATSNFSQGSSLPRQQVVLARMDSSQPAALSARERLRLIREQGFASLSETSPSLASSTDADPTSAKVDALAVSQDTPVAPVAQMAGQISVPEVSPITPTPPRLSSPVLPTQSLQAVTQSELPSNEQQSAVPETTQLPVVQEIQGTQDARSGLGLESAPAEVGYIANEEHPATLDPSNLTLSIENDMEISPSLSTHDALHHDLQIPDVFAMPHEENDLSPPDYPASLLPYIPTGTNEYVVTLPYYNPRREVYNNVLRENEALVNEYTASFRVLPHLKPHPTTISKLDEMFSRLFDICDLPSFMETVATMRPAELAKHVVTTNPKFAFVDDLLTHLTQAGSDKKLLILVRSETLMDLLGHVVEAKGCRYIRSGQDISSLPAAQHLLTVVVSSTLESPALIPDDVDVVIAFDHTYRPELLPLSVRDRSPPLLLLTNTCSIQHLNMRVSENLEPLERKNVLVLALVKAMRYVEDASSPQIQPDGAAGVFSGYIEDPDDDDFFWEPQEIPEDVFEDLHAATQSQLSQPDLQGFGLDQSLIGRKRSHEVDDEGSAPKRPRVSQPTIVTGVSHISDSLKEIIGDDSTGHTPKAMLSISVEKLENLSARIASLETKLEESKQREQQFRELSNRSKKEVDDHVATVNLVQSKFMDALEDRGTFEHQYREVKEVVKSTEAGLESSRKENDALKEKNAELQKRLASASEALLKSTNPELVKMAQLEKDLDDSKSKVSLLEKKIAVTRSDMEYAKSAYQDASQRAGELQAENRGLEQRIEVLSRKADANIVEVNRIHAANESKELLRMLEEQKSIVRDRDLELARVKEELRTFKENRRGTRQSSVPRSPRLSAFNSPRNGARGKGGSSSRGTSPAPPPTGVFETGVGIGTPAPGNRASHLRESRF